MNTNITSLLKIPGFFVTDVVIEKEEIVISARKRSKTARCPTCLRRTRRMNDMLPQTKVLHLMLCNQKVYLLFRKRRFDCLNCHKVFVEYPSFLSRYQRQTQYAKYHALERLSDTSFKATTKHLGISYGSLTSLLKKVFTLKNINWSSQQVKGTIRLGIDEHHFGRNNKYLVTIANLLTGKPIHILPNDKQITLIYFLRSLPQAIKDTITEVAIDMKQSFLGAVLKELPKANVVIDHFHIIQDANRRVNEARKIEDDVEERIKNNGPKRIPWKLLTKNKEDLKGGQQELVNYYLKQFPGLSIFYGCKERLREMYQQPTGERAEKILTDLIILMKNSEYSELYLWANTLRRYQPYILNYFDNHTTNAVTEGLHRKFKLIQRTAYGFRNPEVYARRIMLACLPLTLLKFLPQHLT